MRTNARKFRLALATLTLVVLLLSVFGAVPGQAADPTTLSSSTMVFEGTLTDNGDGTYTGTVAMVNGAGETAAGRGDGVNGFDVYAKDGADATYDKLSSGSDYACGAVTDHDAYTTGGGWGSYYDPDCADWDNYQLKFEGDKWYLEYNANVGNDGILTGAIAPPMSGSMNWIHMYAAETDPGAYYTGMGTPESPGYALDNTCTGTNDGTASWDMDWSWGSEYIPLQLAGFDVEITDLGSDNYRVALTPAQLGWVTLEDFESTWTWFYDNDPQTPPGWHEGGFGQDPKDTSEDAKTPLQIVTDPDDAGNKVLAWTFDGSQPYSGDGTSYFDVFLDMPYAQDWNAYDAIRFKVKVSYENTISDRDYARLYTRLDNNGVRPIASLFGDDDRVWQANNLDVTKYISGTTGTWTQFELNFDNVTNNASYVNASEYNIDGYSGSEVSGLVSRGSLESFRFSTFLRNDRWIGPDEIMTIYFDDIELLDSGITLPGNPGMWVEPHAGSVMEGENTFVDVKATADDVYGVEFDLDFDPSLLEVMDADAGTDGVQISVGSMWPGVEGTDYMVVQNTVSNTVGTIEFAAYLLDPQPEMDIVAGQVAQIEFQGKTAGTSNLDLNDALGATKEAVPINFTLEDGTLEVLGHGSVHGIVEVQGRSGPDWDGAMVTVSGGGCNYNMPVTNLDGTWSISGVTAGIYEAAVEMSLYLDGLKTGQSVTDGGNLDVGQVKVLGGDCNDDDSVDTLDATTLGPVFGSSPPGDARADINDDDKVNILDAVLLGGNWHKSSPVNWP